MASISSTSSTTSTSYNRITGLATGLDTDSMVKQMMQPYKLKVDQAKQARDLQVFKQDMYRSAIKDLRGIFAKYTDIAKPDSLLLTKNYGTTKFTSSNENAVTAEGLSGAKIGNYKVKVTNLAKPARVEVSDIETLKGNKINIDINGTKVDIDLTNENLTENDIITTINAQMKKAGVAGKLTKSDLSNTLIFETTSTGVSKNITITTNPETTNTMEVDLNKIANKKLSFSINGNNVEVDLTGLTTEEDVLNKLKDTLSTANIDVSVDEYGKFTLESTISSGMNKLALSEVEGSVIAVGTEKTVGDSKLTAQGVNANVTITDSYGNTKTTDEYGANEFTIDNVKFKITDVTTEAVSIVGKNDATALKDKLVEFVNEYNKVIDNITTKLNEKRNYNYLPLSDEQKADMTEDQIEKWETKVKQGLLKRDNDLTQITSDLRRAFTDSISGSGITLSQLGIDFSNDISKAGQLVVDENKLKTALEENSDEVVNLFAKSAPSNMTDKKDIYNNSGIFQRIKNILNTSVMSSSSSFLKRVGYEGTSTYSNNDISNDLLKRQAKIDYMESSLATREEKLYLKFANLETVMNNYNSQSTWLSQQFSG